MFIKKSISIYFFSPSEFTEALIREILFCLALLIYGKKEEERFENHEKFYKRYEKFNF